MAVRNFNATKDNSSREQGDGDKQGGGGDNHLICGRRENGDIYRSFVQFGLNYAGMAKIIKAELVLHTSTAHDGQGAYSDLRTRLCEDSWSEGNRPENSFGKDEFVHPPVNTKYHITGNPPSSGGDVEWRLDVTTHVRRWAPTSVASGSAHKNYGIRLHAPEETKKSDRSVFYSRHIGTASLRPYIEVTYEPVAVAPTAQLVGPTGSIPDLTGSFTVNFVSNTLPTDTPSRVLMELYLAGGTEVKWKVDRSASGSEQVAKQLSEPLPDWLKSPVAYEWRATVWDQRSKASAPSARMAFSLANNLPTVSDLAPSGIQETLVGARFTAKFNDADVGDYLALLQIQLQPDIAGGPEERMLPATPVPVVVGAGDYTLAHEFTPSANGVITHFRYYHYTGHGVAHIHKLSIWQPTSPTTGTKLVGLTDSPNPADPTGWREVALVTPLAVTAGVPLRVSYSSENWSNGYTATAPPASAAPHLALNTANSYYGTGSDTYPYNAQSGVNRFVDVVYHEGAGGGGGTSWLDPSQFLWDTDWVATTAAEQLAKAISREYAGLAIDDGEYVWRVRLQDSRGGWSAWVEATFTLQTAYTPDLQSDSLTTGYLRERPPVRILILDLKRNPTTGVVIDRGPGKILGIIEDAANVGASEYLNSPGEFYFTLPATHPQVAVVEPYVTHYRLEQYRRDRWVPIYRGLITDFEATEDETVFYGMDYMAILNLSVDERYSPTNAELAEPTGSKYNDKSIQYVIDTQLTRAKAEANGLTNFIAKGTIANFSEKITIFSTFKQRLDFIVGLIESHKAGTGKMSRLLCRLDTDNVYRWYLFDDYGKQRPNIRLEYGGLVQGFTVIGLGDFGTKFYGVGRIFMKSDLKFSIQPAPGLVETDWGHIAKVTSFNDLVDENDLIRRTRQYAAKLGTIGKRIALGLRVDGLSPYDGYDVGDRVPVFIQYANVDTTRYGSMYWDIVGTEFQVNPDGHTELTLVLLPEENRGDLTIPPDLIPSKPISTLPEWQVGYGVPTTIGEPPSPTP